MKLDHSKLQVPAWSPFVLVRYIPLPDTTESGIYRPVPVVERGARGSGVVVSQGSSFVRKDKDTNKETTVTMDDLVGKRVLFRSFLKDAHQFEDGGDTYSFIHYDDVLAVIPDDAVMGV